MREKKSVSVETYIFLAVFVGFFAYAGSVMGINNLFGTIMKTAHSLLLDTVFFIMAISVIAGAFGGLMEEFGVIALVNKIISPLMRPIYGMPGASSVGILTTFISDNPAIITLAKNQGFTKYFKEYQIPALCNLGTAFGMGLILTTYMVGLGGAGIIPATLIGVLGACIGSVVSVRLMLRNTAKYYGITKEERRKDCALKGARTAEDDVRTVNGKGIERVLNAVLEGGKTGVQLGLDMIPGVLVICTLVMLTTFGPSEVDAAGKAVYTGAAYEGIALLPKLGELIAPLTKVLFGFKSATNIAFPITSLGSTGAAMAIVPAMLKSGTAGMNEIAVFTAMGMCWSGYLSTHISMMDALKKRQFIKSAIVSHTIGGIAAGIAAHYLYMLYMLIAA